MSTATATRANASTYILDSANVHGVTVQLRRVHEHTTGSSAHVVRAYKRDGTASDSNFSGYHAALAAFERVTR